MTFSKRSMLTGFGFFLTIIMCNMHLFAGTTPAGLMFFPDRVAEGEWWRVLSHVFVHVSWYHLVLDVLAVMLLWSYMGLLGMMQRLILAVGCWGGSLLGAIYSPLVSQTGFCGLSGVAHGMMCLVGLCWIASEWKAGSVAAVLPGVILVAVSVGKSLYEVSGKVSLLSGVHLGDLGVPIVLSHLGGVLGGVATLLLITAVMNIQLLRLADMGSAYFKKG